MAEYIDRQAAIEKIRYEGIYGSGYSDEEREDNVVDMIESIPAADVVPASEFRDCRNELCLKCGAYTQKHNGACDGCRWRETNG